MGISIEFTSDGVLYNGSNGFYARNGEINHFRGVRATLATFLMRILKDFFPELRELAQN